MVDLSDLNRGLSSTMVAMVRLVPCDLGRRRVVVPMHTDQVAGLLPYDSSVGGVPKLASILELIVMVWVVVGVHLIE